MLVYIIILKAVTTVTVQFVSNVIFGNGVEKKLCKNWKIGKCMVWTR